MTTLTESRDSQFRITIHRSDRGDTARYYKCAPDTIVKIARRLLFEHQGTAATIEKLTHPFWKHVNYMKLPHMHPVKC